jgi:hypothetical protein
MGLVSDFRLQVLGLLLSIGKTFNVQNQTRISQISLTPDHRLLTTDHRFKICF